MKKFDKLYLHVGLEKTGTTTIQRALHQGRVKLEKLGYLYPKCFAVGRNTYLAAMVHYKAMERQSFKSLIDQYGGTQASLEAESFWP